MDAPSRDLTAPVRVGWRPHALAAVCLATAVAAVWWFGVVARWGTWTSTMGAIDLERYFYPKFVVGNAALAAGRVPLWNPDELCGLPFLASAQVAALYPLKVALFALFPPPTAIRAIPPLHLLLAGSFAYGALRAFGVSWGGGVIGGVLTALCPGFLESFYHPVRIMCLTWAPLVWWAFVRALERRTAAAIVAAGGTWALMFTAGYPLYGTCLGVCFVAPLAWRLWAEDGATRGRIVVAAAAVALVAAGLAAVQLLPLAEMASETTRVSLVAEWNAQHVVPDSTGVRALLALPWRVLQTTIFVAGPLAAFALIGIGATPRAVAATAFGALVVSQAANSVARPLVAWLPGLHAMRAPELIWPMFAPFFVAPLAALGWDRLTGTTRWRAWMVALLIGGPTLTAVGFWRQVGWVPRSVWLAYAAVALAAYVRRKPTWRAPAAACLATGVAWVAWGSLLDSPFKFNPYPTEVADPTLVTRIEPLAGDGRVFSPRLMWHGTMLLGGVPNVQGNEASLRPFRVGRLLDDSGIGGEQTEVMGQPDWDKFGAARQIVDLLGLAAVVVPTPMHALDSLDFEGPVPFPPYGVAYRNRRYRGRVFALHRVRRVTTPDAAFAAVMDGDFRVDQLAIVESDVDIPVDQPTTSSAVRVVTSDPEAVVIDATMAAAGVVVLTDAWFPGWEATVDDVPATILRADYAFRAVALTAGAHTIRMTYRPAGFRQGAMVSLLVAAIALMAVWRGRRGAV